MELNLLPKPNHVEYHSGTCDIKSLPIEHFKNDALSSEEYWMDITKSKISITTKTNIGKFYAQKTLEQLYQMEQVPLCAIKDSPLYPFRSFMIDSARHMQSVDEIKTYINAASELKFNVFHWHLCDDQGWRIESTTYPLLTEKGAFRERHGFESKNPNRYGGYYTKEEIREIIAFCKERYINVIPEIDLPGHAVAMIASYPHLSCRGKQIPVETKGGIFKDILCAGNEDVFDFVFHLLDEITELFPYPYIHIGGDEAPKARWLNCEKCKQRMQEEHLKSAEELQGYFANRVVTYLEQKGKTCIAWNESLNSGILKDNVIIANWMDKTKKSVAYANNGGKIIIEDFNHYYLDLLYGLIPLKKTYNFNPMLKGLSETGKQNVLGIETPIWTEYVEDFDRMCYMCFPRIIAVAESAWTKPENKNYASFENRVMQYKKHLESIGITMAGKEAWNPNIFHRIKDYSKHIKRTVTPQSIRAAVFPKLDTD